MIIDKNNTISILKSLSEAFGVPAFEDSVSEYFKKSVPGELVSDNLGSCFTKIVGNNDGLRILITSHFDEVGFMIQAITNEGYIKFIPLGGMWSHTILGQRLKIKIDSGEFVSGVVATKSPHYLNNEELNSLVPFDKMFIDVGAKSKQEAIDIFGLALGQPICFDSSFIYLKNKDLLLSKAFDNRVGVALSIQIANLMNNIQHDNILFCGASVQEELGARGALSSARLANPDIAIILEGIPADDYPNSDPSLRQGSLGKGVQIRLIDPSAILSVKFNRFVINIAEQLNIPIQIAVRTNGGTDAKFIHTYRLGVPTIVLGVPVRYAHTANSIMDINDYINTLTLLFEICKIINKDIASDFI